MRGAAFLAGLVVADLLLASIAVRSLRRRDVHVRLGSAAAVVILVVVLAAATIARDGSSLRGVVSAFLVATLVVIAAIDVAARIVPNAVVLTATPIVLAGNLVARPSFAWPLAGILLFAVFLVANRVSPAGLGMGDVKLAALVGVGCGSRTTIAVLVAALLVLAFAGLVLARAGVKAGRKRTFAFAPFLAAGAIVATLV